MTQCVTKLGPDLPPRQHQQHAAKGPDRSAREVVANEPLNEGVGLANCVEGQVRQPLDSLSWRLEIVAHRNGRLQAS